MLNIYFGENSDAIYNTNVYFNNTYKDSWITKSLSKEMIKDVDKSEVVLRAQKILAGKSFLKNI